MRLAAGMGIHCTGVLRRHGSQGAESHANGQTEASCQQPGPSGTPSRLHLWRLLETRQLESAVLRTQIGPSSKRTRTAPEPEAAANALLEELAAEQSHEQAPH